MKFILGDSVLHKDLGKGTVVQAGKSGDGYQWFIVEFAKCTKFFCNINTDKKFRLNSLVKYF